MKLHFQIKHLTIIFEFFTTQLNMLKLIVFLFEISLHNNKYLSRRKFEKTLNRNHNIFNTSIWRKTIDFQWIFYSLKLYLIIFLLFLNTFWNYPDARLYRLENAFCFILFYSFFIIQLNTLILVRLPFQFPCMAYKYNILMKYT